MMIFMKNMKKSKGSVFEQFPSEAAFLVGILIVLMILFYLYQQSLGQVSGTGSESWVNNILSTIFGGK